MYKIYNSILFLSLLIISNAFGMDTLLRVGEKAITTFEKQVEAIAQDTYQPRTTTSIYFTKTPILAVQDSRKITEEQTHEVAKATFQKLRACQMTFDDIKKCTILVPDPESQRKVRKILAKRYPILLKKCIFSQEQKMPVRGITIALEVIAQKKKLKKAKL